MTTTCVRSWFTLTYSTWDRHDDLVCQVRMTAPGQLGPDPELVSGPRPAVS